ncbi:ankyrin repeat domain-containing protein [uncultured Parasphingopyxis sp.]|uniref:ankyrin repeat domain-containing protein n=1 Tax=uncultured Parasphingopyxis sp. TaxID=1547918 RepID=UPI002605AFAE|nr:ankyrin repeat domain-containing protein [uncultured Parasphingopyxis sp.]
MRFRVFRPLAALVAAIGIAAIAMPASAQYTSRYEFLNGVRNGDFEAVRAAVEQPGSTVINAREERTGDGALHIVTRNRSLQWLLYLLRARANPNLTDRDGNTALHIASQIGWAEGVHWLNVVQANVNATNGRGETPLVLAVQQRNSEIVQQLIEAGADPDITDAVVGRSAMDYARQDPRGGQILSILESAQPREEQRQVVGPVLD